MDTFTSFLSNVAKTAQKSVVQATSAVQATAQAHHAKFLAEREAYTKGSDARERDVASQLPWEGMGLTPRAQEASAEVRAAVESMVKDGSVFKSDPPTAAGWRFDMSTHVVAMERLLEACPAVDTARHRLVPRVMTEARFFSNLFFGIELIRQSALNGLAAEDEPAVATAAASTAAGPSDAESDGLRHTAGIVGTDGEDVAAKPALVAANGEVVSMPAASMPPALPRPAVTATAAAHAPFRRVGEAEPARPRPQRDLLGAEEEGDGDAGDTAAFETRSGRDASAEASLPEEVVPGRMDALDGDLQHADMEEDLLDGMLEALLTRSSEEAPCEEEEEEEEEEEARGANHPQDGVELTPAELKELEEQDFEAPQLELLDAELEAIIAAELDNDVAYA